MGALMGDLLDELGEGENELVLPHRQPGANRQAPPGGVPRARLRYVANSRTPELPDSGS